MSDKTPIHDLLGRIKEHWPTADTAETDIVFMILRLQDLIRINTESVLDDFDLSHASFEVLVALRARPEPRQLTPTELYRSALLSSGGTTKILIQLESRGLIERIANPSDGRSKIVRLTDAGAALVETAMTDVMACDRSFFTNIEDPSGLSNLRATLFDALHDLER
ncbi:putative HTH-type transcriptional regulator/GBAA_1941/BAS1801 [Roseovarius albus]|uniref:Putative HTH-type transcriptional regulator/GBAA_1941/BAS1801 n=1 Tax=Roseovarius albus TaxID=1247867 RepID=A0A1X6ZJ73_9RHOB|nr:MarR family transcriptional regulator [Roseovarius albus]SLN52736.1 putative HTH-type transcriptional regulator/GBAA_1941/BAS1801 [Roseovarius albus]